MIAIILCNGPEDKWAEHRGVRRHFVEVDGERLIDRTVRQIAPHATVVVSGPDDRYKFDGAALYVPQAEPEHMDADIILSTRHLWSSTERTLVLLGDTWFSDAGIARLVKPPEAFASDWFYVGREGGSVYSGTNYGEIFALSFWPEHRTMLLDAARTVVQLRREGLWRGGMWEHYRVLEGIDPEVHEIRRHFLTLDDETEDFDFGPVYEQWLESHRALHA